MKERMQKKKVLLGMCHKCGEIHYFDQSCARDYDFPVVCREYNYISRFGKPIIFTSSDDATWFLEKIVKPEEHKDYKFTVIGDIDQYLIFYEEAEING